MFKDLRSGFIFTSMGQFTNIIVMFVLNMVLSRILNPAEIGVVALVQVFLYFFQSILTSGIAPAIIQNKKLDEDDYSSLLNFAFLIGLVISIAFGLLGFIIAKIYKNGAYIGLFWSMSLLITTELTNSVPNAVLNKRKQFKEVNIRLIVSSIFGAVAGVASALMGAGAYALVLNLTFISVISLILNLYTSKIKIKFMFNRESIKKIIGLASNQSGVGFIIYFSRNFDNLIVGKKLGDATLGVYSKAYSLMMLPNMIFTNIFQPLFQPIFSNHQDNIPYVREVYLQILRVLLLISAPVTVFFVLDADKIVLFMFGNQWAEAFKPTAILCSTIWVQMTYTTIGPMFLSCNKYREQLKQSIISVVILALSVLIGAIIGNLIAMSICVAVAYILNFFVGGAMLMKLALESTFRRFLKLLISPLICAVIITIPSYFVFRYINFGGVFIALLFRGLLIFGLFGGYLLISGEFKNIMNILKNKKIR